MAGYINNVKQEVLTKTWDYLNNNFHKFSDGNKLKVSLAIALKDMPTQMEGEISYNKTPDVNLGGKPLEYDIGSRIAEYSEEAPTATS